MKNFIQLTIIVILSIVLCDKKGVFNPRHSEHDEIEMTNRLTSALPPAPLHRSPTMLDLKKIFESDGKASSTTAHNKMNWDYVNQSGRGNLQVRRIGVSIPFIQ